MPAPRALDDDTDDVADPDLEFPFDFALPELLVGRLVGVTPASARLCISGDRLTARFGPWRVDTPLANVAGAELSGPYWWPRIIGPARLSLWDRGLTFATTDRQGVCIRFRRPVRGIEPLGLVRHRALTVTVADAPALVEVLQHAARASSSSSSSSSSVAAAAVTIDEVMGEVADDLHSLTARELRDRARGLGIEGVASMKKDELVDVLTHHRAR
jgi:hypothetical protein